MEKSQDSAETGGLSGNMGDYTSASFGFGDAAADAQLVSVGYGVVLRVRCFI